MWDLPGPRLEPVSPALAGGFLTTVPPGKSLKCINLFIHQIFIDRCSKHETPLGKNPSLKKLTF